MPLPLAPSVTTTKAENSSPPPELENDERWLLAKKIVASATLSRSSRLAHLLLYLCERSLAGPDSPVSEQQIAAEVFERKGGFDPAGDTIVRSNMLRLRQKLEAYFSEEGAHECLRIQIPRGGYTPVFERATELPSHDLPLANTPGAQETIRPLKQTGIKLSRWLASGLFLCMVVLVLGTSMILRGTLHLRGSEESPAKRQLWASLFNSLNPTLIVAADSGLVMLHGITGRNTTLAEYLAQDFAKEISTTQAMPPGEILNLSQRRYTSFVDIELFDRLTHVPAALGSSYSIRYARDVRPNDMKVGNVILSGSRDANPWVELYEPQMNFVLHNDLSRNERAFLNRHSKPGEDSIYRCDQFEYGVLAYLPGLNGSNNALLIGGTSVAGTEAISDFLFEGNSLEPFLENISATGHPLPHFELLLRSRSIAGSASRTDIVAYRIY